MNLEADNLTVRVNNSQEIIIEPQYAEFLRENGYTIDGLKELQAIPSESDNDKAYVVGKLQTYRLPKDHSDLDVIEDQITIPICSCWSYRQNSADVTEGEEPNGQCKHTREAFMTERAASDDSQTTL